jgi:hypothetical protein
MGSSISRASSRAPRFAAASWRVLDLSDEVDFGAHVVTVHRVERTLRRWGGLGEAETFARQVRDTKLLRRSERLELELRECSLDASKLVRGVRY